jgi:pimeloyl-ACP methyl ester carboxylesterase
LRRADKAADASEAVSGAQAPERIELDLPLYVERTGQGDPIVLLHGYGASRVTWMHWAPALAKAHSVHLVDLRGFGSAAGSSVRSYGPGDMADDVLRMILELDLRRVTLVGHSMGGGVALLVALGLDDVGERDRLTRLVSVSGTAYAQKMPPYLDMLRRRPTQLLLQLLPTGWLIRKVIESIVYDPKSVTDAQVERYAEPLRSRRAKRAAVVSALQLVPDDLDARVARYPEIDVPTLVLWGRHDPVVPLSIGERLTRDLPNARLVVLERCGHIPPEERPEASLAAVEAFMEES